MTPITGSIVALATAPGRGAVGIVRLSGPALQPLVLQRCVFAHRSGERGHEFMLQHLGVQALLDLGLRLGEGSGAALAWPLLQSACAILREMASFASAGVSEKSTPVVA